MLLLKEWTDKTRANLKTCSTGIEPVLVLRLSTKTAQQVDRRRCGRSRTRKKSGSVKYVTLEVHVGQCQMEGRVWMTVGQGPRIALCESSRCSSTVLYLSTTYDMEMC